MKRLITLAAVTLAFAASALHAQTSTSTATLGTVRIPTAVMADGKSLSAGTYQVRLTTTSPAKVVGQTLEETRWIEFLQGGTVAGREVATVVADSEMRTIEDRPRSGATVKVETLKGGDYLRVWIRHSGTHYLIHLPKV